MDIAKSVVAITGGASGLGAGAAEVLLKAGAKVAIFDMAPPPAHLTEAGAMAHIVDVANEEAVKRALDETADRFGAIHACVNSAGIVKSRPLLGPDGPFPLDLFDRTIAVNLTGTFLMMAHSARLMALNEPNAGGERGVIVNVASIAALDASSSVAYAASKGGVVAMSLTAARDLSPYGIRVNAICPGYMETSMFAGLAPDYVETLKAGNVFPKRLGQPEEFGRLAMHIMENAFINAATYRFDAGARV